MKAVFIFSIIFCLVLIGGCVDFPKSNLDKSRPVNEGAKAEADSVTETASVDSNKQEAVPEKTLGENIKEAVEDLNRTLDVNPREDKKELPLEKFKFPSTSIVKTVKGVSVSIDSFEIEDKGTWGKITKLRTTILNEGDNSFLPAIGVRVYGLNAEPTEKYKEIGLIEFDEGFLEVGQHITKDVTTPISYKGNGTLVLKLVAYDKWKSIGNSYIAEVETTFQS